MEKKNGDKKFLIIKNIRYFLSITDGYLTELKKYGKVK